MSTITAQTGDSVNAETVDTRRQTGRMPRKTTHEASAFWKRLEEAVGQRYQPFNANNLADRLDMSQGTTHRWFLGTGFPELKLALRFAKEGGVCVDWLLNNVKPKYPISKDPVLRELFEICEDLSPSGRESVLRDARGELLLEQTENEREQADARSNRASR